jgi:hypothetical protein
LNRPFAAFVIGAALLATADRAYAGSTTSGAAQLVFTAAATMSMTIATQYSATGTQGNAVPTLLPSAAGVCTAAGSELNFTLTFGALNEQAAANTACLYKNAVSVGVNSNDAAGFIVNEYLDTAPTTGVGICAFPNGGASFPLTPATAPTQSARAGNQAAGTFTGNNLTSCAAGGAIVPTGAGGAVNGGTVPGNPTTPGVEYYSPSTATLQFIGYPNPTVNGGSLVNFFAGEDIQVNLVRGAGSTVTGYTGLFMTIQLVPN